jgi:hypothetical protein
MSNAITPAQSPHIFTFSNDSAEHLTRLATPTPRAAFSGVWTTVELQPDVFVPQRFTIGIVVQEPGDRLHFKLLDDFKKFECIYHEHFPQKSVRELLAYAEEALRHAAQNRTAIPEIGFETHCLTLAQPRFTSGDEKESTVERLFNEVVVMAPSGKRRGSEFESIDTPRARALVNAELKRIAGMDFEKFVVSEKQGLLLDDPTGHKHWLDLNLLTAKSCGSVTSAAYKSAQTVEMNLLKASLDLTTYRRIRNFDSIGLFLLMPDAGTIEPREYKRIEEVIDQHEWKLERDGFRVTSLADTTQLAQEIYDWAKPDLIQ